MRTVPASEQINLKKKPRKNKLLSVLKMLNPLGQISAKRRFLHFLLRGTFWKTFLRIQRLLQHFRPLAVEYSPERGFHSRIVRRGTHHRLNFLTLLDFLTFLILIASGYCLHSNLEALKGLGKNNDRKASGKLVMACVFNMAYIGAYSMCLGGMWTCQKYTRETISMITNCQRLSEKRKWFNLGDKTVYEAILIGLVVGVSMGVLMTSLVPAVIFGGNPVDLLVNQVTPNSDLWIKKGISCLILIVFEILIAIEIVQPCVYLIVMLHESMFIFLPTVFSSNTNGRRGSGNVNVMVFQQATLLFTMLNQFGYVLFAVLMASALLLNVSITAVCIKFHQSLHPILLASFVAFDIVVLILTAAIHTVAMMSVEGSYRFHQSWKRRLSTKLEKKEYRACIQIRINIGPFFAIKRRTLFKTLEQIVNQTVTILMI